MDLVRIALSLLLAGNVLAQAAGAAVTEAKPKALALLVGINQYEQPTADTIGELKGTENDVAKWAEVLQTRFGFAAGDVVTLAGNKATHAAIVQAFHDHLIAKAGPDTQVVFCFSGHGSRVPDQSKAETGVRDEDGRQVDETLIAYDSRAGDRDGSYDITDDELHSLLAALKSHNVLVVTDCCHSGGLMRGDRRAAGVRAGDDGKRPLDWSVVERIWPKDVPFLDDDRGDVARHYVQVAACASDQEAGELDEGGKTFGTLTWFLTGAMSEVPANTSWCVLGEIVRARVAGSGTRARQFVELYGDQDRPMLGGTALRVPPGFRLRELDNELRVEAGRVHGLADGAQLRLVGLDGKDYGRAQVTRARPHVSEAAWVTKVQPDTKGIAMRAQPIGALGNRTALRVRLGDGVDAKILDGCPSAVVAGKDAEILLVGTAAGFELRDLDGRRIRAAGADATAVHSALFHENCFRSLWEVVSQRGQHAIEIAVAPAAAADVATFKTVAARVDVKKGARAAVVADELTRDAGGGLVELRVTNRSKETLHVAILSVAEDRSVNLIWGKDASNAVDPGATKASVVVVGPGPGWPADRSMVDRYLVIATLRYADFSAFVCDPNVNDTARAAATRGGNDGMPEILRGALGGPTRGGNDEAPWGVGWLDLEITRPPAAKDAKSKAKDGDAAGHQAKPEPKQPK